jgi:hypothetical protein
VQISEKRNDPEFKKFGMGWKALSPSTKGIIIGGSLIAGIAIIGAASWYILKKKNPPPA